MKNVHGHPNTKALNHGLWLHYEAYLSSKRHFPCLHGIRESNLLKSFEIHCHLKFYERTLNHCNGNEYKENYERKRVDFTTTNKCAQRYKEKSLFYKVKSSRGAYQNCVYTAHLSMDVNASSGIVFPLGPIFTNPP